MKGGLNTNKEIEKLKLQIKEGLDIDSSTADDIPIMHLALDMDNPKKYIQFLLDNGADIDVVNTMEETLLQVVAGLDDTNLLEFLIMNGAHVNTSDYEGMMPLYNAIEYQKKENVELLLKHGASIFDNREELIDATMENIEITKDIYWNMLLNRLLGLKVRER